MKTYWGISALNHDASITVVRNNEILFAAHAERYSRIKNDQFLNDKIISAALQYGEPDEIVWFEKPFLKKTRQAYAGQWSEVMGQSPRKYMNSLGFFDVPIEYVSHHHSHAAAGYFTTPLRSATVIVIDAIGEWDTITVWKAIDNSLKKVTSVTYPDSIGLLYSAMTQRIGLKPNEEEYILMGMAAYGEPKYVDDIKNDFIYNITMPDFKLKENVHRGISWWRPELTTEKDYMDIAASIQQVTEECILNIVKWAADNTTSPNLVLMGGVALNCVANEKIAKTGLYDNIWLMPNPGDSGSSLGAIAAYLSEKLHWKGPYLGTTIDRHLDVNHVVDAILEHKIIGIANGRAEFGPRALGNRSLIADPRGDDIKSAVNDIKKRQQFRPFAPIVLEEFAHEYFDMPVKTSPYMQFTAMCKRQDLFPAICHVDGSSRVQTVNYDQHPKLYAILLEFYNRTGCPILLNTSLNIKGEPLVDTWDDALRFQEKHGIKIF